MNRRLIPGWGLLTLLVAVAGAVAGVELQKPQFLRLQMGEFYLRTEMQYESESQQAGTPALTVTREQTLLDPALGMSVSGSLFHPNLLQFSLAAEVGLSWDNARQSPGGSASSSRFLQRYHATVDFLAQKPYAVSLFGDKEMTYREYDFFSRVRVDSESFGGRAGYMAGPVPFTVSVQHYDESQDDPTRPQQYSQDTLWVTAQNQRHIYNGSTRLNYNLSQFSRRDDGYSNQKGVMQSLSLFDSENFGGRIEPQLTSLLNYNTVAQTAQPTEKVLIQENLRLHHSPRLESYYEYALDSATAGDGEAITHEGQMGVSYQQTPHLTFGGNLHGSLSRSASPGNSLDTKNYGVGASAQYARQLASWLMFVCGDDARLDREDRTASGTVQEIPKESVTLTGYEWSYLKQPLVIEIKDVYNATNSADIYHQDADYEVGQFGALTAIRRKVGGNIFDGTLVAVHYSAALQDSSSYDTLANNASFRVDFWKGLVGIYGHWARQVYSGGDQLLLRRMDDKTVGVDSTWRWFRAGAEYEVIDSNLAPYQRRRLFQSAQFQPVPGTDISLNADQNWTDFQDNNLRQTAYGFITRMQQRLTPRLSATLEGGVRFERGETFNRDYATCRAGLDYAVGKITVKLDYEYNNESHLIDMQERHYIFLRLRRDFR